MKIYIDSDIIIDLLLAREPFNSDAEKLFSAVDKGNYRAFTTVLCLANIYYVLKKINKKRNTKKMLSKLRTILDVLPLNKKIFDLALSSDFRDFEDSIQYYACLEGKIDFIITRNKKDFKNSKIPVNTAGEFNLFEI